MIFGGVVLISTGINIKRLQTMLPSDPRQLLTNGVAQALLLIREYWIISNQVVELINNGQLTDTSTTVTVRLSSGVAGDKYNVTVSGITTSARTFKHTGIIKVIGKRFTNA